MRYLDDQIRALERWKQISLTCGPVIAASHPRSRNAHDGAKDDLGKRQPRGQIRQPSQEGQASILIRRAIRALYGQAPVPALSPTRLGVAHRALHAIQKTAASAIAGNTPQIISTTRGDRGMLSAGTTSVGGKNADRRISSSAMTVMTRQAQNRARCSSI